MVSCKDPPLQSSIRVTKTAAAVKYMYVLTFVDERDNKSCRLFSDILMVNTSMTLKNLSLGEQLFLFIAER